MNSTRRLFSLAIASPLALTLASCSDEADGAAEADTIAPVEAPEGTDWNETVTVSDVNGYVLGNPDAPIKLVEYASHTCGACANFSQTAKPEIKDYVATGTVSFEQREVFLNTFDVIIAALVQCGPKERMQPLSDEVWGNLGEVMQGVQANPQAIEAAGSLPLEQRFVEIAETADMIDFFAARGLSADQARECLTNADGIEAMVRNADANSQAVGITGTPTFLLNGEKVDARQWPELEPMLQRAGARQE